MVKVEVDSYIVQQWLYLLVTTCTVLLDNLVQWHPLIL